MFSDRNIFFGSDDEETDSTEEWVSDEDSEHSDSYASDHGPREGYYYCSSCGTYHRDNDSTPLTTTYPYGMNNVKDFSPEDLLFHHPLLNVLDTKKRPTEGSQAVRSFVRRSVEAYLASVHVEASNEASPSTKDSSTTHQVDKELLEKAKIELSKFEKKEIHSDEMVEEVLRFNLGQADTSIIELNIDNKIYKTTRKTIMKYESLIKVMIENKESGGFDIETDSEGRIVFRSVPNSNYFKYILMFFRGEDEPSSNQEIPDEITSVMKKKFKFITEGFNLANYLEFHDICNYFCVKDLLYLIEKKIDNFENPLSLEILSEKYRNIEQEKQEYSEKIKTNDQAISDMEEKIRELLKQLKLMEEQKSKLIVEKMRLRREQDLVSRLFAMKSSFKNEEVTLTSLEDYDVVFNIGGEDFSFKSSELLKYESSLLYKLVIKCQEKSKSIFLDRDPSLFSYIYNFIKNQTIPTGLANQKQIKLIEESIFFGIDDLTVKIDIFRYPVEELSTEDREIRETESILRRLFSFDRENTLIDDPFVNLISVFDNTTDFYPVNQPTTPNMIFDFEKNDFREYQLIASGKEEFDFNFKTLSGNIFEELDWNGVFIAGGSIQRCCRAFGSVYNKRIVENSVKNSDQDIDIFLHGLTKSEAEDKIRHIYSLIKKNHAQVIVLRTKYTVTFSALNLPSIQVVTRLYKSPAEVLIGFDIDSCCVGYDGNKVWCLPRFRRALTHRYNLVDIDRQSLTYESRLKKYAIRGFRILVPGYKPELVKKPGLLDHNYSWNQKELSGLALLLYFQASMSIYPIHNHTKHDTVSISSASTDSDEEKEGKVSDYGDFFCQKIISCPFPHMLVSYKHFIQSNKSNFLCVLNDVESVIDSKDILTSNHTIPANIEWITEQPHRQLLGSLFPVFDNFYVCAYDVNYRKKKDD